MVESTSFDGEGPGPIGRPTMDRPIAVTDEDVEEFRLAMEAYKRRSGRLFPTWSEILEVLHFIGYDKRIWRPVAAWSPLMGPIGGDPPGGGDALGLIGWFSTVETPVGP